MNSLRNPMLDSGSKAVAMDLPFAAKSETNDSHNKFNLIWATIAVLGAQLVIRLMMVMRQFNY